jgi:hypothetical protein
MANSTQGSKLEIAPQTAFGSVGSSYGGIRVEGAMSPMNPGDASVQPDSRFADEHQKEKPVTFEAATEDGLTLRTLVRQPTSAGGVTTHSRLFGATGFTEVSGDDTTTAGTPTAAAIDLTDDNFGVGYGVNIETPNYGFIPTVISTYTSGGSPSMVPVMALPEAPAAAAKVNKCRTYTPGQMDQVAGNKLVTLKQTLRAEDSGNVTVPLGQDGGVMSWADLTFTPGELLTMECTMGFSDVDISTTASIGTDTFLDQETGVRAIHEPLCQFADTPASFATAISAAYHKLISMTFSWGVTLKQLIAMGDVATVVNNICGYMMVYGEPMITLDLYYNHTKWADWDDTNTSKYVSIIQPGAAETDAAWALVAPRCHIFEKPTWTNDNEEHRMQVKMFPKPAGMDGSTSASQGNQPYYWLEADRSA